MLHLAKMKKSDRAKVIKKVLDKFYPETPIPLNYEDVFTLLIAVLLSAQCTDERVNKITPKLFSIASSPLEMSKISVNVIYKIIKLEKGERYSHTHEENTLSIYVTDTLS